MSDLHQNDLEEDGCAVQPRGHGFHNEMAHLQRLQGKDMKQIDQDRFDSAYSSGFQSYQSSDYSSVHSVSELESNISCENVGKCETATTTQITSKSEIRTSLPDSDVESLVNSFNTGMDICDEIDEGIESIKSNISSFTPSFDYDQIQPAFRNETESERLTEEALRIYGKDEDGDSLLHVAIIQSQVNLCMVFIQMAPSADWLDIYNNDLHQTPLHLAVIMGLKHVVRRLIVGGANIEMRDHNGDTPLHIASREGHYEIVRQLLTPVTSQEERINEYYTKMQHIPQNLTLRNCAGYTCIHEAVLNGKFDVLDLLLKSGADINAKDGKQGASVIHYAAMSGNEVLMAFLVKQRGVRVDSPMYCGTTPAKIAYLKKNSRVYDILVKYGAKVCLDIDMDASSSSEDEDY